MNRDRRKDIEDADKRLADAASVSACWSIYTDRSEAEVEYAVLRARFGSRVSMGSL